MTQQNKILLIDGHGLAFRAFYAVPFLSSNGTSEGGTPTNVLTGFMNMLASVEKASGASDVVVVFDAPSPTFRHELYAEYKAQRKPTPPELKAQIPILKELLSALGYPLIVENGVEADDVIASLALKFSRAGKEAVIVSSDKDIFQTLAQGITMLRPTKGMAMPKEYDEASFTAEYGFSPLSMPDYQALLGDAVDNVPGVPGIGEKTALQLIGEFETLERLYEALDSEGGAKNIKPAVCKRLEAGREMAFKSRDLTRLKCDVMIDDSLMARKSPDRTAALEICKRLGMTRLFEKITKSSAGAFTVEEAVMSLETPSDTPDVKHVDIENLFDAPHLGVFYDAANTELQIAAPDGKTAVFRGLEIQPAIWTRLSSTKFSVNDYKEIISAFGRVFEERVVWDLKTAHYLLHPDKPSHGLEDVYPEISNAKNTPDLAFLLFRAERELTAETARYEGLDYLMSELELPLLPVLVDMERAGVRLSGAAYTKLQKELEERVADIENNIAEIAGETINLNSPKQVAELLFGRLGLPNGAKTKGKTGFSTGASVLESLANSGLPHSDVPRKMLEHRELTKMLSGFVMPLQRAARSGGGVIHTTLEAASTGTGRLSSRDPNLQNLPSYGDWARRLKEGIVPVKEGNVFVAADYSQIELRVLAKLSGEARLIEAFASGRDIHRETASWVFGAAPESVTQELRRVAKMINFGLLYGMSAFGLAERLGVPRGEASGIVERYFRALPGIKDYLDKSAAEANERGYTRTLFGRIRPMSEAMEGLRDKGAERRIAVNTPIQGTAADIARRAMLNFSRFFAQDTEVRLFLQIHDSLVMECPEQRAESVGQDLARIMKASGGDGFFPALEVSVKTGKSLADV
ncbi:DNA polymerase [Synergistales bacterium]|nr:DNA polymerase [Synergistales bacterium]